MLRIRQTLWKSLLTSSCFQHNTTFLATHHVPNHQNYKNYSQTSRNSNEHKKWMYFLGVASSVGGAITVLQYIRKNTLSAAEKDLKEKCHTEMPGMPTYSSDDISKHDKKETRVWVSYGNGVYDITDFVAQHPGGDKINMAAGGALEPFWQLYAVHKNKQVFEILEKYRIGNLLAEERDTGSQSGDDPYAGDPRRHPILKPSSVKPFNAEPPLQILADNFITPNEVFFVRNHLPVPEVDLKDYSLEIEVKEGVTFTLSLDDLKNKFPKHKVITTIQCAGNRRSELNKVKEVKGLNWGGAAISTAEWGGARLTDVFKHCGIDCDNPGVEHVQFEGLDTDPANSPYGASIPAHKAFDIHGDVLLAYEMNGSDIPRDHGYPVRVIVPGVVGARNVKWLSRIILSDEESHSHWQRRDYKGFSPMVDWNDVDFDSSPSIQELPVNSAICEPGEGEEVVPVIRDGKRTIQTKGYAWSGGGRKIVRVDVSADGGTTWTTAQLQQEKTPLHKTWSWTIWKADVPLQDWQRDECLLIVKAVDSSYNVQPETFPPIWNLRGVLGNAWHRLKLRIKA